MKSMETASLESEYPRLIESSGSLSLKNCVNILSSGRLLEVKDHDSDGNIGGGDADSGSGELASKLGKSNSNSLTCTGLGNDHVKGTSAATTVSLVVVIDEVLVVGEGVHGSMCPET